MQSQGSIEGLKNVRLDRTPQRTKTGHRVQLGNQSHELHNHPKKRYEKATLTIAVSARLLPVHLR